MKLSELPQTAVGSDQIIHEQHADHPDYQYFLLGIDPTSSEHALTVAELKRLKRSNPRLYHKVINLD